VIITDAALARLPMLQVTVPLAWLQVPVDAPVHVALPNVTPAGSGSVTTTPVALLGPLFVAVMAYARELPTKTGSGESLFVTPRSVRVFTVVLVEAVLFPEFRSVWLPAILALFVIVPAAVGVTVIVIVTDAPLARLPRLQVTVPLAWLHVPADAPVHVAAPNVTPAGSVSVTTTPVAAPGPLFVAVTV
jgi:hypothetical protein